MNLALIDAAVLSRLESTGLPVGDARAPEDCGWESSPGQSTFRSYLILWPLQDDRQGPNASIGDPNTSPELRYQVTAVGSDRWEARAAGDLAFTALTNGVPLDLDAATVLLAHDVGLGTTTDESVNPPVMTQIDRYRVDISSL